MTTRARGRPRSEAARIAVLAAAVAFVEQDGYAALTMEAIARRAAVSKQTIYRWWPGKAAVVLEALTGSAAALAPDPDTGVLATDVRDFVARSVRGARRNHRLLGALMAEAQLDPAFAEAFESGFLAVRRDVLTAILERGRGRGELRPEADPARLAELVFAGLWYRILTGRPLDRRFAESLADTVLELAS